MLVLLSILLQFSFSKDFTETKNLFGGVFAWPGALAYARKMWKWIRIPQINFNYTDINIAEYTKQLTAGKINFNLTKIIQDNIGNLFSEDNDATKNINALIKKNYQLIESFKFNPKQFLSKNIINSKNDGNSYCNEEEFPNAYLLNIDPDQFDCKLADDFLGQIFSYAFIVMPLAIIFILTIIFYIIFCFGRCCCFKPKSNTKPNTIEIIFFSIISLFELITILITFAASIYLIGILKYVLKNEFQQEVEGVCYEVNPSMNKGLTNFVNSLIPSISSISNESIKLIDKSLPNLVNVLDYVSNSMNNFSQTMKDIETFGNSITPSLKNYEKTYSQCSSSQIESPTCPREISFISEINFGGIADILEILSDALSEINNVIDVSSSVDEGKQIITDSIDKIEVSLFNFTDVTVIDSCNFSEFFDPIKDVPSFVLPLGIALLILLPLVMIIILAIQICAFWTKGCCARTCSMCCFPCSLCAIIILIIGIIPTFLGFIVIFCDIVYNQGDDALDTVLKEITNDDKILEFGTVNMSSFTKGVIGPFRLENIQIQKIEFFKNLIDAKLNTPFSKILSFHQLPFNNIAGMIEKTLFNAAKSIHLDELIVGPINETIDAAFENLPDLKLDEIANTDEMKSKLSEISHSINCCNSQFNSLNNGYTDFFNKFDQKIKIYSDQRNLVDNHLRKVPSSLGELGNDLFGGLLKTLGRTFANAFRKIEPSMDNFKLDWIIGAFNVIRVNFLYNFMCAMMCLSISSHLYMFGMIGMTIILWIRRRGMGREDNYNLIENENDSGSLLSAKNSQSRRTLGKDDDSLYSNLID